ncbi:MAG: NAD(+) synthase [Anaerovoracaceae bacterium]
MREDKMMDFQQEVDKRVAWIQKIMKTSGANGIIFGNSGGKDSALVGILCKMACDDTVGIIMPCQSKRNFGEDMEDGRALAESFQIESRVVDLTQAKQIMVDLVGEVCECTEAAVANIAPRLRMTTLYLIGQSEGRLVAGTGNASERYMGYFTKWGDGAYDFNPISDLAASEIYPLLEYLGAPNSIIQKAPSAGLYEGQTDELEMGVTYQAIDQYMKTGQGAEKDAAIIERAHRRTNHKRNPVINYTGKNQD